MTPKSTGDEKSSEELARQAQAGCRASFEELVRRHTPALFRFLRRYAGCVQDAEDLAQEAFLRAYRQIHRYDVRREFRPWLYTIARRLAISRLRRARPSEEALKGSEATPGDPHTLLVAQERQASVWQLTEILPSAQREVLWLKYGEELSVDAIARVTGKSGIHVKVLLHRGRRKLARCLAAPGQRHAAVPQPALAHHAPARALDG